MFAKWRRYLQPIHYKCHENKLLNVLGNKIRYIQVGVLGKHERLCQPKCIKSSFFPDKCDIADRTYLIRIFARVIYNKLKKSPINKYIFLFCLLLLARLVSFHKFVKGTMVIFQTFSHVVAVLSEFRT